MTWTPSWRMYVMRASLPDRARVAEAALCLSMAWLLVRLARFGRWRRLVMLAPTHAAAGGRDAGQSERVRIAIERAERRLLRRRLKCLPRAVAAQWMLRRRGIVTRLVIGAAPDTQNAKPVRLHAWLEQGGRLVIGERDAIDFAPFNAPDP